MPGPLLHIGATVNCSHLGVATPGAPNAQVLVSAQATVTQPTPYAIAGCSLASSGSACVTGTWTSGTTRVTSNGQPLVIATGLSTCVSNGTPMLVVSSQTRVIAT
ncbi:MAG TPA: hypothetical protein VFI49_14585 [Rudaea sp.]|nr:hypothetical protein [Rudaea sp.]